NLPPALGLRTTRISVADDEVTLALRDAPEVRLGAPRDVAAKGRAALAVLASTAATPPRYIDVRVPGAPVAGGLASRRAHGRCSWGWCQLPFRRSRGLTSPATPPPYDKGFSGPS